MNGGYGLNEFKQDMLGKLGTQEIYDDIGRSHNGLGLQHLLALLFKFLAHGFHIVHFEGDVMNAPPPHYCTWSKHLHAG